MKTFYMKTTMKFLKLLPALIFFMLALSYNARSQTVNQTPVCYGQPIELFCSFLTGGCGQPGSTYHWENYSGSWSVTGTGPTAANPIINVGEVGYASDKFYLSVQYAPPAGGFSGGRVTVTVRNQIVVTGTPTPVLCFGQNTGTITLNVSGGVGILSYAWQGPGGFTANTKNLTGLAKGIYSVTVTDQALCSSPYPGEALVNSFEVTGPDGPIVLNGVPSDLSCPGVCDGAIGLTASGGTGAFTYSWTGPNGFTATTEDISGLCAGTYYVTATDANNCKKTGNWPVDAPDPIVVTDTLIIAASCNTYNDGSITIEVDGGALPYSFSWTGPGGFTSADQNIALLEAGPYTVVITDDNGCQIVENYTVGQPEMLIVTGIADSVKCFGESNGQITLNVSGGTGPFQYLWADGPTTDNRYNLPAGMYYVTVTDNHSCVATGNWEVGTPEILEALLQKQNTTCHDSCNGTLLAIVSGGVLPYSYLWTTGETTADRTNLCPGDYTVTVKDKNNCSITLTETITAPEAITITNHTVLDASCPGYGDGSISIDVTGGTGVLTYSWSGPGGFSASTKDISGLYEGSYLLTITDENNCSYNDGWDVYEPTEIAVSLSKVDITCKDAKNGSIQATVSGGTPGYTYSWSGPLGYTANTQNISDLGPGLYTLIVTDAHNCAALPEEIEILEPGYLLVGPGYQYEIPQCNGGHDGSIYDVAVSGGTQPYGFYWEGPNSFTATTPDISGLYAGTYFVTVTDKNGCQEFGTFELGEPDAVVVDGYSVPTKCFGSPDGEIHISAVGGTGTYTYVWDGPGGFTASAPDITGLVAGMYYVTVSDTHGCEGFGSWEVTSPALLVATAWADSTMCFDESDGAIHASATGGSGIGTYSYSWTGPDFFTGTGPDIYGVVAGEYTVTVVDYNNCVAITSTTVYEPGQVSWTGVTDSVTCFGASDGTITETSLTGGTPPYTYYWEKDGLPYPETTGSLTNLAPGLYELTVTDAHSCDARADKTIYEPMPLLVGPGYQYEIPQCNGGHDGRIYDVAVSGGTLPYTFYWEGPNGFTATTQDISGLYAGTYFVTVTDKKGCQEFGTFELGEPDAIVVTGDSVPTKCFGSPDGEIHISAVGGTGTYTYVWDGPGGFTASTPDITGLVAGTYNVTVSDAHSCEGFGSWEVTSPALLVATAWADSTMCFDESDGAIHASATGGSGIGTYSYSWTGPDFFTGTGPDIYGVIAGDYFVTVTDYNNCVATAMTTVYEPGQVSWTGVTDSVTCFGASDGTITETSLTGGTPPYTYYWEKDGLPYPATTGSLTNLAPGLYELTVTDAHSCDARADKTIYEPALLVIVDGTVTSPTCYQGEDGSITNVIVTGGTLAYSYLWSNGETTASITGLEAGFYTLTVTDFNNCQAEHTFEVLDAPWWSFEILGPAQVCCNTSAINTLASYTASDLTGTWSYPVTYQWTVEGGSIQSGQNTDSITVLWSCCGNGKVYLTVHQGNPYCSLTKELPVIITATPAPVISGPISVTANDTVQYCVVNGDPTHLFTWSVPSGVVFSGQGTPCITVIWGDYPICGCGVVSVCESIVVPAPGVPCMGCTDLQITILPNIAGINLSGTVTYKNAFGTALNGVTVKLRNTSTNNIVATTVTGPNMNPPNYTGDPGYYAFMNVPAGNYKIEASFNGTWGGNNATDALLIQLESGSPGYLLNPPYGTLNLAAANVNGSTTPLPYGVSALDALYVKLRTVGSISSYPAGDWKFDDPTFPIPFGGPVDFNGLCFGDVNGSYIPTGLKELSFLSVVEDMTQTVPVEETFNYEIRSNTIAKLGAMTLFMGYDAERFEVIDIVSQNDEMKYVIENGTVAIAWADTKPVSVQANDQLFTLTVKAKAPITEASQIFTVKTGSEFADALGNRYDNFELKLAKVITPNGSNEFSMFNYPNPFTDNTKVVYTLPESGNVKLVITDMYGKTISTLVNDLQTAGTYTVNVNAAELNLSAGVYLYRIEVAGATENFVKINKLIFAR